ncbi:transaldolase family protein [Swaminathania salitolerans]|uniref:Putative transaldolase n=1 Tax=Swaminathania salitolerans TaxID=182838 RepID=A0A511BPV3_9PROT|nr:transaldolase family protein [Swaminathania salitolerans]GEL02366.1 putative transaldolase [Swaminathania salitolerans]
MAPRACPVSATGLRLFLDTADRDAWSRWLPTGLFHGVTTNPTILARSGLSCTIETLTPLLRRCLDYPVAEIQAQCWGTETDALIETGLALAAIDPRMVVKVPITENGIRAVARLHAHGVRTTLTAVYAVHQAVTAAAAGSDYVAPYFGRIGDSGRDAFATIDAMRAVLRHAGDRTRLLVASLRQADDLAALCAAGCDTFTFSPAVAEQLFADPQTVEAAATFERMAAGL